MSTKTGKAKEKPRYQWSRNPMETDWDSPDGWGGFEEHRPAGGTLTLQWEGKHQADLKVNADEGGKWWAYITVTHVDETNCSWVHDPLQMRTDVDRRDIPTMREAKVWAERNARAWLDAVIPVVREARAEAARILAESKAADRALVAEWQELVATDPALPPRLANARWGRDSLHVGWPEDADSHNVREAVATVAKDGTRWKATVNVNRHSRFEATRTGFATRKAGREWAERFIPWAIENGGPFFDRYIAEGRREREAMSAAADRLSAVLTEAEKGLTS